MLNATSLSSLFPPCPELTCHKVNFLDFVCCYSDTALERHTEEPQAINPNENVVIVTAS